MTGKIKEFYDRWHGPSASSSFLHTPRTSQGSGRSRTTRTYPCSLRGAVLIGQPGTGESITGSPLSATTHQGIPSLGKTTFSKFVLARLISTRQVVVLCDGDKAYLFYNSQVYRCHGRTGSDLGELPTLYHKGWNLHVLIWIHKSQELPLVSYAVQMPGQFM